MLRRFSVNFAILSMLFDGFLTALSLWLAYQTRPILTQIEWLQVPILHPAIPLWMYFVVPIMWVLVFLGLSAYDPKRLYYAIDEMQAVTLAVGMSTLIFAGLLFLVFRDFSRWLFLLIAIINWMLLIGWRAFARLLFRFWPLPTTQRRVLIVGAGVVGRRIANMMQSYGWMGLEVVGFLDDADESQNEIAPLLGSVQEAKLIVEHHNIQDVVIALPQRAYGKINRLVWELHDLPVNVRVIPDYFSLAVYRATVDEFGGVPMINLREPALNEVQRLLKRLFDLFFGLIAFCLALPVMVVVGLLVRLDSSGPILFRQERLGENGRPFGMYKFRSMIVGAEQLQNQVNQYDEQGNLIHKRADDPRITRIGKFLRRTSLDELPQLLNVLKGEMSLVGPRPELPWLLEQYEPWQWKRFAVPQGMTGWWQVNGRADKLIHMNAEDDLYYIQNYSLWMDIYILLKTPWVVLKGKGAY